MAITTEAIYEKGMLRLAQPIPLSEGTRVEVIVIAADTIAETKTPSGILAEIAAMPLEGNTNEFSGRDHDAVLYSQPNMP